MAKLSYRDGAFEDLEDQHRNLRHEVQAVRHQVDNLHAQYPNLDFQYNDPEPNFDRSKVLGVVAKLFTVKDPKFMVAIDAIAGGRVSSFILFLPFLSGEPLGSLNGRNFITNWLQSRLFVEF